MQRSYLTADDAAPLCAAALDLGAVINSGMSWPPDLLELVMLQQLTKISDELENLRAKYAANKRG